jgi:hypothetical protein
LEEQEKITPSNSQSIQEDMKDPNNIISSDEKFEIILTICLMILKMSVVHSTQITNRFQKQRYTFNKTKVFIGALRQ